MLHVHDKVPMRVHKQIQEAGIRVADEKKQV
jgi:hypothetical protein